MTSTEPDSQQEDRSSSAATVESTRTAQSLFEQADGQLVSGRPKDALVSLNRALALDPENPCIQSRLALAMVRAGERFDEARAICEGAVKRAFNDAGPYVDLARLYLEVGRRAEALRCLRRGRMIDPGDETIGRLLEELGERRAPVLSILPRRHVLNRLLGALRARLSRVFGNESPTRGGLERGPHATPTDANRA